MFKPWDKQAVGQSVGSVINFYYNIAPSFRHEMALFIACGDQIGCEPFQIEKALRVKEHVMSGTTVNDPSGLHTVIACSIVTTIGMVGGSKGDVS